MAVLAATQTFTNKTVVDATFSIIDDADATKIAKFQASGITTATTRTYTLPDISDTLVTLTATQTLTNKSLTSPAIATPVFTGLMSGTDALTLTKSVASAYFSGLTIANSNANGFSRIFLTASNASTPSSAEIDWAPGTTFTLLSPGNDPIQLSVAGTVRLQATTTGATVAGILNATGGFQFNGAAFPITQSATDTDRAITQAGTFTFTHGLSGAPKIIQAFLVCQTGELNYTAGQIVAISYGAFGTATTGLSLINGATTIVARYGNTAPVFTLPDATTGTVSATTNANWKLRIVVYA